MKLFLHMRQPHVKVLGPGDRYGVWVAGCHRNCPGCIAPDAQDMTKGTPIDVSALAWEIILTKPDGITISGGEPFLQAEALAELVRMIRRKIDVGVIVYTGFLKEELDSVPGAEELLSQTDLLIDGPYVKELDDGQGLRGSSNQRIWDLSSRYGDLIQSYTTCQRKSQVFHRGANIHFVGIPKDSKYK